MVRECPHCNVGVEKSDNFCPKCGKSIKTTERVEKFNFSKNLIWFFISSIILSGLSLLILWGGTRKFHYFNSYNLFFIVTSLMFVVSLIYFYAKNYEKSEKIICWLFIGLSILGIIVIGKRYPHNLFWRLGIIPSLIILIMSLYAIFKKYL